MTKRKASIFTVIESVPNWFSASQEDNLGSVESKITPTVQVKANAEVGTSSQTVQATSAETANCVHAKLPTWPPAGGSRDSVHWSVSRKAGTTAVGDEGASTSDWPSRTEVRGGCDRVTPTGIQSVERADTGDEGLANGPSLRAGEEVLGGESPAQRAFWALLKDAGYEIW